MCDNRSKFIRTEEAGRSCERSRRCGVHGEDWSGEARGAGPYLTHSYESMYICTGDRHGEWRKRKRDRSASVVTRCEARFALNRPKAAAAVQSSSSVDCLAKERLDEQHESVQLDELPVLSSSKVV